MEHGTGGPPEAPFPDAEPGGGAALGDGDGEGDGVGCDEPRGEEEPDEEPPDEDDPDDEPFPPLGDEFWDGCWKPGEVAPVPKPFGDAEGDGQVEAMATEVDWIQLG